MPVPGIWGVAMLTPKLGIQYLHLHETAFHETGADAFGLSARTNDTDSIQPFAGVAAAEKFITADGSEITPEARLAYSRDVLNNNRVLAVAATDGTPSSRAACGQVVTCWRRELVSHCVPKTIFSFMPAMMPFCLQATRRTKPYPPESGYAFRNAPFCAYSFRCLCGANVPSCPCNYLRKPRFPQCRKKANSKEDSAQLLARPNRLRSLRSICERPGSSCVSNGRVAES